MRYYNLAACLMIGIVLLSVVVCRGQISYSPITTADQAEQQARKVFQLVNWPDTGEVTVKSPPADSKGREKRWSIRIGEALAEFDGGNGELRNLFLFNRLRGRTTENINIDEKTANAHAIKLMTKVGLNIDEARIVSSKAVNSTSNPGETYWQVIMRRYYKEYEYADDFIVVNYDPNDGSLMGFGYNFDSPQPLISTASFTREQAITQGQASDYFQKLNVTLVNVRSAELKIVIPNNYWDIAIKKTDYKHYVKQPYSRLAWVMEFDATGPSHRILVWVDAENGAIIGGARSL